MCGGRLPAAQPGHVLPFHLETTQRLKSPGVWSHSALGALLARPCPPAPTTEAKSRPQIHHRLPFSASSSCLNRFL